MTLRAEPTRQMMEAVGKGKMPQCAAALQRHALRLNAITFLPSKGVARAFGNRPALIGRRPQGIVVQSVEILRINLLGIKVARFLTRGEVANVRVEHRQPFRTRCRIGIGERLRALRCAYQLDDLAALERPEVGR